MEKRWWASVIVLTLLIIVLLSYVKLTGFFGTSLDSCIDTDFGRDYYKEGTITGQISNINTVSIDYFNYTDECINERLLKEYYCETEDEINLYSYPSSIEYLCMDGCMNGRCIGEKKEMPLSYSIFDKFIEFLKDF